MGCHPGITCPPGWDKRTHELLQGGPSEALGPSVWLLCWCSHDYDWHEEPREAYRTEAEAMAAAKAKPEGLYNDKKYREGWSVLEVQFAPEAPSPITRRTPKELTVEIAKLAGRAVAAETKLAAGIASIREEKAAPHWSQEERKAFALALKWLGEEEPRT